MAGFHIDMFYRILMPRHLSLNVYHFIFDRLRSIRQDLIVQNHPEPSKSIEILQICARFHLLASYKLSQAVDKFDKDLNFKHMLGKKRKENSKYFRHSDLNCFQIASKICSFCTKTLQTPKPNCKFTPST